MTHHYHDFIVDRKNKRIDNKRYWLELTFDENKKENLVIILKNPSKATIEVSDHTVNRVTKYVYLNKDNSAFKNIGKITIINLIPYYETKSSKLISYKEQIIDEVNKETIRKYLSENKNVIIAWGNHPSYLYNEYEQLKEFTLNQLKQNQNNVFYVHGLTKNGNPKHGQVWGYKYKLKKFLFKN